MLNSIEIVRQLTKVNFHLSWQSYPTGCIFYKYCQWNLWKEPTQLRWYWICFLRCEFLYEQLSKCIVAYGLSSRLLLPLPNCPLSATEVDKTLEFLSNLWTMSYILTRNLCYGITEPAMKVYNFVDEDYLTKITTCSSQHCF